MNNKSVNDKVNEFLNKLNIKPETLPDELITALQLGLNAKPIDKVNKFLNKLNIQPETLPDELISTLEVGLTANAIIKGDVE